MHSCVHVLACICDVRVLTCICDVRVLAASVMCSHGRAYMVDVSLVERAALEQPTPVGLHGNGIDVDAQGPHMGQGPHHCRVVVRREPGPPSDRRIGLNARILAFPILARAPRYVGVL